MKKSLTGLVKTNKKAIDLMHQVEKSELKFVNLGAFLLEFFLLDVDMQMKLAQHLHAISIDPRIDEHYVIKSFILLPERNSLSTKYNMMLRHSFKCKGCGEISDSTTNSFSGKIRELCSSCMDKAMEYQSDSIANQFYD
jgi:hypothetical protein